MERDAITEEMTKLSAEIAHLISYKIELERLIDEKNARFRHLHSARNNATRPPEVR